MLRARLIHLWRMVTARPGRQRRLALSGALLGLLVACSGYLLPAISVGTTTATLVGSTTCQGNSTSNPCTGWFQYWPQGATATVSTTHTTNNTAQTTTLPANVTGLAPNTLYHEILCGYGDTNIPSSNWACTGPLSAGNIYYASNLTCQTPGSSSCVTLLAASDLSNTGNFRTGSSTPTLTGTVDLGRALSTADTPTAPITRDGGISVSYQAGSALWLFGDTEQLAGSTQEFLGGTTAASGAFTAGQAPQALNEVPTPPAAPQTGLTRAVPFLPNPILSIPGTTTSCSTAGNYAPAWTAGAALEPGSSTVLIVYGQMCVHGGTFTQEGLALIEYNPATNQFANGTTPEVPFFANAGLPGVEALGHPVFGGDGFLYLFTVTNNAVYAARVTANAAAWGNAANYRWWDTNTSPPWSGGPTTATPYISFGSGITPEIVTVGNYAATTSHAYVALVETNLGGEFMVLSSSSLSSPSWTQGPTVIVPDTCSTGTFGCYAIEGHPELSSSGNLVYSWFSPDDHLSQNSSGYPPPGHIRLANIAW